MPADLSLADLAVLVSEYTAHCQDCQHDADGRAQRRQTLAALRDELRQRVLDHAKGVASHATERMHTRG